jgi:serine phosphatase RsbU (regulator of sigma subunit)
MLGVPLIAGEDLVGVLHVGTRTPRHFTDEDVAALGGVAEEIALAIAAERALDDRSAAEILQRSLLPTRLPVLPGLEFAARFVPAGTSGLGGDWYDAFALPSGRLGVVMGDVAGHGLRAAVVMGRLRSVLRAYAFEGHAPAAALALLDRKFAHFEPDEMATILYAELDPGADRLVLASAGHPLPLSAADEAPATFLDVEVGPPIGTHVEIARTQADHRFTPGTMLAFYTDGLFERRHQPIDSSLERLRRAVRPGPAELSASVVMAEMIGADVLEDDTALLVVRRVAPT